MHLILVQNVPTLTTKFANVSQALVGYSLLSFSEPLWRPQYITEATVPQRFTGFVKSFHFQTHHIKLQTTDLFLPNYACQRKPHQTSRLAYVCKQLGRSVPTSCLILFSCRVLQCNTCQHIHKGAFFCSCYLIFWIQWWLNLLLYSNHTVTQAMLIL